MFFTRKSFFEKESYNLGEALHLDNLSFQLQKMRFQPVSQDYPVCRYVFILCLCRINRTFSYALIYLAKYRYFRKLFL